jgi:hypothetical protein
LQFAAAAAVSLCLYPFSLVWVSYPEPLLKMGNGDIGNLNLGTGGAKGLPNEAVERMAGIAADPGSSESES